MRIEDRLRRRIEEYKFRQRRRQMMQSVKAMKSGLSGINKLRGEAAEKSSPPIVGMYNFCIVNLLKINSFDTFKIIIK